MNLVGVLFAGAALIAAGAFAAAWGRQSGRQLVALPVLAAGAALCFAGVSRFAAGRADPDTGQELAALLAAAALAATILGAAWARRVEDSPLPRPSPSRGERGKRDTS
jgi:drug/metabolite transporter (DMT)-like permease